MKHITLGRSNARVSAISLGTWSYGGANTSGSMPIGWHGQEDRDSRAALIRAWELNINHWDTADVYGDGRSEKIIGSIWETVPRQDIFLASKMGWDRGRYKYFYHPEQMRNQIEKSLENLKTDVIDLYYFHHCQFGQQQEYLDAALDTMRRFREEGKIRFIGLSDWNLTKIMDVIERVDPDIVQPYRNVMDDSYASSGLKAWIDKHKLGVCFFSPIKHGLITGKYQKTVTFPKGDFRSNIKDFSDPDIILKMQENRSKLEARFSSHPQPVMHGIIDALLTDAPSGCVLLGQRNVQQVESAATLGTALTVDDAQWVKSLYQL